MSLTPKPPSQASTWRLFFALVVIVAAIGVVLSLALAWPAANLSGNSTQGAGVALTRTPLADATAGGAGGLVELASPTPNPTNVVAAALTPTAPGANATGTIFTTAGSNSSAERSLRTLDMTGVPPRDLYSIVPRLRLKSGVSIPRTTGKPPGNYKVGQTDTFYISDLLERYYYTVTATIYEVTEHAYWYAQDGSTVDKEAIKRGAKAFEETIYPQNTRLFGEEWKPGVDGDPRITVLFAPLSGAGGYYSSADEYTRIVNPFSNEREIIYINTGAGWGGIESTLAHEHQHMIHWHLRPNHDVWLNEGAAVLASAVNGYDVQGVDREFLSDPGVQLNGWQQNPSDARPHYGAAFLFLEYLRAHYGGDRSVSALVSAPGRGTDAVDNALANLGYKERFVDVYKKWVQANLVDGQPGAEQLGLEYPGREVGISPQVVLDSYPAGHIGEVSQFGAQYIRLVPPSGDKTGPLRLAFSGDAEIGVIPSPALSGSHIWWSNRGDLANTRMTRRFDLRALQSATLRFGIWFSIEEGFDYGYVEVSTDGGTTWATLKGAHTTNANPNGLSFGNAYTGNSAAKPGAEKEGWLREEIDLTPYAGKEALIRFEYITDDGYNAQGFAVDEIEIPELGYKDDAEGTEDGGWLAEGFVRLYNKLPQRYALAVVKFREGGFDAQTVDVGSSGSASFTIEGLGEGQPYKEAMLVISGLTPHSIGLASYELSVRPEP